MSYLLYQQLKVTNDGRHHPLDGYEPDEVLIHEAVKKDNTWEKESTLATLP